MKLRSIASSIGLAILNLAFVSLNVYAQGSKSDLTSVDLAPPEKVQTSANLSAFALPGVTDTFRAIPDTKQGPWKSICMLTIVFPTGAYQATGTLVGKHHVLTAGHNIFDPKKGGWAKAVYVTPGYSKGSAPYGTSNSVKLTSMIGFTRDHDINYDLGFVITADDLGDATGWFGMMPTDATNLVGMDLRLAGYPSEGNYDGELLQETPCAVIRVNYHKVFYRTNTYMGLSGAPLFFRSGPFPLGEHPKPAIHEHLKTGQ